MAWTDTCKIQAVETITKLVENDGITKDAAIRKISRESDIPFSTVKKWVYPPKQEDKESGTGPRTKKKLTQEQLAERAMNAFIKACKGLTNEQHDLYVDKMIDARGIAADEE